MGGGGGTPDERAGPSRGDLSGESLIRCAGSVGLVGRWVGNGFPTKLQDMSAIEHEDLQGGPKQSIQNQGGGFHGGAILLPAVRGVSMDQLPSKEQESMNQFAGEMVDLPVAEPAFDLSSDLLVRAELLGAGFDPPVPMKERAPVDLHQQIDVLSEDR